MGNRLGFLNLFHYREPFGSVNLFYYREPFSMRRSVGLHTYMTLKGTVQWMCVYIYIYGCLGLATNVVLMVPQGAGLIGHR